ncbi:MAG TPA: hypothetical protein VK846_16250 [Candidatus Limnocylindria bacterium]|nr:hypothetical protein [Candidatus Limnocylindria bacterium]
MKLSNEKIICSDCGAEMPDDRYARMYGRCAKHADEEKPEPPFKDVPKPLLMTWANRVGLLDSQARTLRANIVSTAGQHSPLAYAAADVVGAIAELQMRLEKEAR